MQLDRLTIRNFRNFEEIDIPISPGTVIVGENRAGKSNLVHGRETTRVPGSARLFQPVSYPRTVKISPSQTTT
jgi:recombinational DNA repair ATPase RecF